MRCKPILLALLGASLAAGCASFAQKVSDKVTPALNQKLSSGAVLHDTILQKGALTSTWMACGGGPDCSAQLRAFDGGTRPQAVIYPPRGCHLASATLTRGEESTTLPVLRGYTRPHLLTLEKRDVLTLAEGGTLAAGFAGCPTDTGGPAEQTREILFDREQLTEIGTRLRTPFTEMVAKGEGIE
ncbi:MAG: hypothetical protein AAFR17_11685 [Pseudomonadota bacterium]